MSIKRIALAIMVPALLATLTLASPAAAAPVASDEVSPSAACGTNRPATWTCQETFEIDGDWKYIWRVKLEAKSGSGYVSAALIWTPGNYRLNVQDHYSNGWQTAARLWTTTSSGDRKLYTKATGKHSETFGITSGEIHDVSLQVCTSLAGNAACSDKVLLF